MTKLADRGTFQTIGLVTDVEPFLRSLVDGTDRGRRVIACIAHRSTAMDTRHPES